jgi:hypothetical protein
LAIPGNGMKPWGLGDENIFANAVTLRVAVRERRGKEGAAKRQVDETAKGESRILHQGFQLDRTDLRSDLRESRNAGHFGV